jgi:hypothetical protein
MKKSARFVFIPLLLALGILLPASLSGQAQPASNEAELLAALHSISSHTLYEYVQELVLEKYGGRLTGTPEYNACADWVASLLAKWGVRPAGDGGTYMQSFPNPYTLVFPGCEVVLRLPVKGRPKSSTWATA